MDGSQKRSDTRGQMRGYRLFETAIGDCGIAWDGEAVIAAYLPAATPDETARQIAARADAEPGEPPAAIVRAIEAITALLNGNQVDLSFIDCRLDGVEPFAQSVYAATRAIPRGETRTYGEIAEALGNKQFAQGVGQALGHNPIPIIIPCHRVMGASGRLTGFSAHGGVQLKLKLLEIEGAAIGGAGGLFDDLPLAVKPPNPS